MNRPAIGQTIEALADGVMAFRMRPPERGRGTQLAVLAAHVSFVRHLLLQLQDPPAYL